MFPYVSRNRMQQDRRKPDLWNGTSRRSSSRTRRRSDPLPPPPAIWLKSYSLVCRTAGMSLAPLGVTATCLLCFCMALLWILMKRGWSCVDWLGSIPMCSLSIPFGLGDSHDGWMASLEIVLYKPLLLYYGIHVYGGEDLLLIFTQQPIQYFLNFQIFL